MKRLITLVTLLALAAFIGCQSDNSSTPTAPPSWQTELFLPDAPIVAAEGTAVTIPITAQVTNKEGVPAAGVEVAFRLLSGEGDFDHSSVASDAQGLVAINLLTTVRKGAQTLSLSASTTGGSAKGDVILKGTGTPYKIDLLLPAMPVTAPTDAPIQLSLKAMVTDDAGSGLAGIPVSCRLENGEYDIFGSLTGGGFTAADGSVSLTFTSQGNSGSEQVVVATDTSLWQGPLVEGLDTLYLRKLIGQISHVSITVTPPFIDPTANPDSLYYADIRVVVTDADNVGIPNIVIDFATDKGTIYGPTPTNTEGVSKARFCTNFEVGVATITAIIPGTQYEAITTIQIKETNPDSGFLRLSSDFSFKYADNGLTEIHLKARLTDQDNVAIVGKIIAFSTGFGAVAPYDTTDAIGIANAIFVDLGMPSLDEHGIPVPVWVKATYRAMNLVDSVGITIRQRNPVDHITLSANKQQIEAGSWDSVALGATCFLLSGDYAPQGITVTFAMSPQNGRFTNDVVPVGSYGHAETFYLPGQFTGPVSIHAQVFNEGGEAGSVATSNDVIINILPGPPSGLRLTANPSQLRVNDPSGFSTITAFLTDTAGNPVTEGTSVRFSTTKGSVSPSAALTNASGRAMTRLTAGSVAGPAEVTGTADTPWGQVSGLCTVTFIPGYPNSIQLEANPDQIPPPRGVPDGTSTLRVTVRDAGGNLIQTPTTVVFQILNNPDLPLGGSINNHGDIDSSRTAGGIAVASFNSGTQSGPYLIRAYTWRDPDSSSAGPDGHIRTDTISTTCPVAVVGGPPFAVDIDMDSRGEDVGGGTWKILVTARVFDLYMNPVADRIPVVFTVDPDNVATIEPGYTGNDVGKGATHGIAYAYLYYNSVHTFAPITISAVVQAPAGIINGQRPWILPLQRGQISLNADPTVWSFSDDQGRRMTIADTCTIRTWATVTDGHGVLINGAPILFSTDRGHFYWKNERFNGRWTDFFPEPVRRLSGAHDQENNETQGVGTVYLRGWMNDFFLDDIALEVVVHLQAQVEGYEDVVSRPATVTMTRR